MRRPGGAIAKAGGAPRWGVPEWFIVGQTVLPALLYFPGTQKLRVPIRVVPFALSLAGLAWLLTRRGAGERKAHPAAPWLLAATFVLALMILHPTTNSRLAGIAQVDEPDALDDASCLHVEARDKPDLQHGQNGRCSPRRARACRPSSRTS